MSILQEYLELGGVALKWPPPSSAVTFKPLFASEQITLLSGQVMFSRGPVGGIEISIKPGDTFGVDEDVKAVVLAALAGGMPLHVAETYSNPAVKTVRAGCVVTAAQFTEMGGTERRLYNYDITLLGG